MDKGTRLELIARLREDADRICVRFGLRYRVIEPERANVKLRYGICYSDGTIKIRLHHTKTREPLKYSSLVSTLCHELAHLRHFNHSKRFQDFNETILMWCRRQGIYLPGRPPTTRGALPPPPGLSSGAPSRGGISTPNVDRARTGPAPPEQLALF
ncbi:MAG: DUF45 domain-containing protein [Myxococcota bacterium]|nr:DUF45 domain-containing protein [Myxococcota bacterium]